MSINKSWGGSVEKQRLGWEIEGRSGGSVGKVLAVALEGLSLILGSTQKKERTLWLGSTNKSNVRERERVRTVGERGGADPSQPSEVTTPLRVLGQQCPGRCG